MLDIIKGWYQRHFSDPQAVILALLILFSLSIILILGETLAPVLVALVFAYLLEGVVHAMARHGIPRSAAATIVLLAFAVFCLILIFGLVPLLSRQLSQLLKELPNMLSLGQEMLMTLPETYPQLFTLKQINEIVVVLRNELASLGQNLVSFSIANVVNVLAFLVYAVLVPLMVFFLLKDKKLLLNWINQFLPQRSDLTSRVWGEVDLKIANYIRGKFIEIMIVWGASYITFIFFDLNYSLLLSFLVGISVIIPFVGAVAVTVPVALIAFFQWGITAQLGYLLLAYQIIQVLDGNILVPVLFSEVVNLHPLAIIVAVLFFGGLWGIWGVFFAIPLATFIQALLNAWPSMRKQRKEMAESDQVSS